MFCAQISSKAALLSGYRGAIGKQNYEFTIKLRYLSVLKNPFARYYSTIERVAAPSIQLINKRVNLSSWTKFLSKSTVLHTDSTMQESKKLSSDVKAADHLIWIDCEMTGLDVEVDHILEVACIITDANLKIIAEGPNLVIHQSNEVLDNMNDWCKTQHGKTGLTEQVRNSLVSVSDAETTLLNFVQHHTIARVCPLAGNSVHADKRFLDKYMPRFMQHLHYRIVDVSTIKELCRRWYPKEFSEAPMKALTHRALDDIKESIAELEYYRKHVFKSTDIDCC